MSEEDQKHRLMYPTDSTTCQAIAQVVTGG